MKSWIFFAGAAAFAASLATGAPASAGPQITPVTGDPAHVQTTVVLGDLDLSRLPGAETAVSRIRRAAKAVCGADDISVYMLAQRNQAGACMKASMRDAVTRLDHPMVTFAAYGGDKAPTVYAAR